jgi:hypothetical protein
MYYNLIQSVLISAFITERLGQLQRASALREYCEVDDAREGRVLCKQAREDTPIDDYLTGTTKSRDIVKVQPSGILFNVAETTGLFYASQPSPVASLSLKHTGFGISRQTLLRASTDNKAVRIASWQQPRPSIVPAKHKCCVAIGRVPWPLHAFRISQIIGGVCGEANP